MSANQDDAQAAKPPTVRLDRATYDAIVKAADKEWMTDDEHIKSRDDYRFPALISALPGLTTAPTTEPDVDDDFAADQAEHWLEDCINGEGWLDSELGSLHNALAVIRRLRSAPAPGAGWRNWCDVPLPNRHYMMLGNDGKLYGPQKRYGERDMIRDDINAFYKGWVYCSDMVPNPPATSPEEK